MAPTTPDDSADHYVDDKEHRREERHSSRRSKYAPACTTCRNYKTRCLPVTGRKTCQTCLKRSIPCIFPGPAEPRMKSSEKISELEKKVAFLTSALANNHSITRTLDNDVSATTQLPRQTSSTATRNPPSNPDRCHQPGETPSQRDSKKLVSTSQNDVFQQGVIGIPSAEVLFQHWNVSMRPVLPILKLAPGTTVTLLREDRPNLLLAILAVASPSFLPSLEAQLMSELRTQLARQVLWKGNVH